LTWLRDEPGHTIICTHRAAHRCALIHQSIHTNVCADQRKAQLAAFFDAHILKGRDVHLSKVPGKPAPGSCSPRASEKSTQNQKGSPMKTSALVASLIVALSAGITHAETDKFDSVKFFERLQLEGASMPKGFDSKRFFEKLATEGASSSTPLSAEEFFEKLRAEGASVPVPFDGSKFMNTIRSEGLPQPDLIVPNK